MWICMWIGCMFGLYSVLYVLDLDIDASFSHLDRIFAKWGFNSIWDFELLKFVDHYFLIILKFLMNTYAQSTGAFVLFCIESKWNKLVILLWQTWLIALFNRVHCVLLCIFSYGLCRSVFAFLFLICELYHNRIGYIIQRCCHLCELVHHIILSTSHLSSCRIIRK